MLKIRNLGIIIFVVIIMIGCIENSNTSTKENRLVLDSVEENTVNDSLVNELALFIEESIYNGNHNAFSSKFDLKRFGQMATYSKYPQKEEEQFKIGFLNGLSNSMIELSKRIYLVIDAGGFYDYLYFFYDEDLQTYKILFRLYSEFDGINYHEYHISSKGEVLNFSDIFVYLNGESLSQTINKLYLANLPQGVLQRILRKEDSEDMMHLLTASNHLKLGQNTMALESLRQIKGELRKEKIFHVISISASSDLDEAKYLAALEEMKNALGSNPTADLLSFDYYLLKEKYDVALKILDDLQSTTEDDFLDYIKGNVYNMKGDYKNAILSFQKIIEEYPEYYNADLNLIVALMNSEGNDACIPILDNLLAKDIFTKNELTTYLEEDDEYGENVFLPLINSSIYKNWKK